MVLPTLQSSFISFTSFGSYQLCSLLSHHSPPFPLFSQPSVISRKLHSGYLSSTCLSLSLEFLTFLGYQEVYFPRSFSTPTYCTVFKGEVMGIINSWCFYHFLPEAEKVTSFLGTFFFLFLPFLLSTLIHFPPTFCHS